MELDAVTITLVVTQLAFQFGVFGFLWKIQSDIRGLERRVNRDINNLAQRLARIEGMLQVWQPPKPSQVALEYQTEA